MINIPQSATMPIEISGWSLIHLNRLESLYSMMIVKILEEALDFLDDLVVVLYGNHPEPLNGLL